MRRFPGRTALSPRSLSTVLVVLVGIGLLPARVEAEEEAPDGESFEEPRRPIAGARAGVWIDALLDLEFSAGDPSTAETIDAEDDLGIDRRTEAPHVVTFADSRWTTVRTSYWRTEYEGSSSITRERTFGAVTITSTARTESEILIQSGRLELQGNALNDEYVRLGVLLAGRVTHARGEVEVDQDADGTVDDREEEEDIFVNPALGVELTLRPHPVVSISGRASYYTSEVVEIRDVEGWVFSAEVGATVYPFATQGVSEIGLRGAWLFHAADLEDDEGDDAFAIDMDIRGALVAGVLRF